MLSMPTVLFDMKLDRHISEHELSVVLIVSPLVSLMVDQVSSLRSRVCLLVSLVVKAALIRACQPLREI